MELKSLKLAPAESKKEMGYPSPSTEAAKDGPRYPWGTSIDLNDEALSKLGITKLPEVGETLAVEARVTVTSVSSSQTIAGEARRSCCLQITELGLGPVPKDKGDAEDALYKS